MKPLPHLDAGSPGHANHVADAGRATPEGGGHAPRRAPLPAASSRRYPSLSDDGQPWIPIPARFNCVRVVALAAIVAIIGYLAANH